MRELTENFNYVAVKTTISLIVQIQHLHLFEANLL